MKQVLFVALEFNDDFQDNMETLLIDIKCSIMRNEKHAIGTINGSEYD